jgi:hypothetical protein
MNSKARLIPLEVGTCSIANCATISPTELSLELQANPPNGNVEEKDVFNPLTKLWQQVDQIAQH